MVLIGKGLLLEEDKVLQDDFLLLFEGLAVGVLCVEGVQDFSDADNEEIADIRPVTTYLAR